MTTDPLDIPPVYALCVDTNASSGEEGAGKKRMKNPHLLFTFSVYCKFNITLLEGCVSDVSVRRSARWETATTVSQVTIVYRFQGGREVQHTAHPPIYSLQSPTP